VQTRQFAAWAMPPIANVLPPTSTPEVPFCAVPGIATTVVLARHSVIGRRREIAESVPRTGQWQPVGDRRRSSFRVRLLQGDRRTLTAGWSGHWMA